MALVLRLYVRGGRSRLAATWLVGISAGVLVRAVLVGHVAYDFWGVALAFTALFVLAGTWPAPRSRTKAVTPPYRYLVPVVPP